MNKLTRLSLMALLLLGWEASQLTKAQVRQPGNAKRTSGGADQALIERGRYIVEGVAMCERCHTPRDEHGVAERRNWLMGGPVQTSPTYPAPNWATREPRIAGDPPGTDQEFITLMTTGIARTHLPPNPPMPQFHMTRADAEAVLAYLKSLP